MAKTGIEYYARDVDLMRDRKFNRVRQKHGYLAYVIYDALLELIYSDKGYYIEYNEGTKADVIWELQNYCRGKYLVEDTTIDDVIEMLVACELFSGDHFKQGIITSQRIQKVYYKATVERHKISVDPNIWMLSISEMKAISERSVILQFFQNRPNTDRIPTDIQPNCIENQPNCAESQPNLSQSKVKESKVKESKVDITVSKDTVCRTDVQQVADKWNTLDSFGIRQISRINSDSKRYSSLVARIKQYGLDNVLLAIERIKQSSFLCGDNNRSWTITFDWFVKPSNFPKVLEGNYDNKPIPLPQNGPSNESFGDFKQRMQRWGENE